MRDAQQFYSGLAVCEPAANYRLILFADAHAEDDTSDPARHAEVGEGTTATTKRCLLFPPLRLPVDVKQAGSVFDVINDG